MDDLFQIGCIGLMKAIDNFDLSQNVKFSTYAVPMIMGNYADISGITTPSGSAVPCGTWLTRQSMPKKRS